MRGSGSSAAEQPGDEISRYMVMNKAALVEDACTLAVYICK
jgi:hypothetical protein